ncbi:class I SAM-dependent methyltransferase [Chloroflexota bacterium]
MRKQFVNYRYLENLEKQLSPGSEILDLGCGAGKPIDRFFIDKGHSVSGIDISKTQIKLAKRNVPKARYKVKDISTLKRAEYQVNAVVSFYTIFHIPREKHGELLNNIHSFLLTGGMALFTMGSFKWEGIEEFYGTEMYFSQYDPEVNREIVERAGFKVVLDEIDAGNRERHQVILARKNT